MIIKFNQLTKAYGLRQYFIKSSHYLLLCDAPVEGLSMPDTGLDGTLMPFSANGPSIT